MCPLIGVMFTVSRCFGEYLFCALIIGVSGNPRGAGNHAVIAGVIVVVVVFILVLLFVVTVLYKVFKRRRMGVVTSYGGLNAMMVENELPLDNTSPVVPAAAVSVSFHL